MAACDGQIEAILTRLRSSAVPPVEKLPAARYKAHSTNAPAFEVRKALHAILGVDLTQIHGLGPYLALKLVGECGTNLSAWPTAKHFTSWPTGFTHLTGRLTGPRGRSRRPWRRIVPIRRA